MVWYGVGSQERGTNRFTYSCYYARLLLPPVEFNGRGVEFNGRGV
jgi:hypothetical protein